MLLLEEMQEKFNETLILLELGKPIESHETEIQLLAGKILLSSERITLSLDQISTLIHKIEDKLIIIRLSGVTINKDF